MCRQGTSARHNYGKLRRCQDPPSENGPAPKGSFDLQEDTAFQIASSLRLRSRRSSQWRKGWLFNRLKKPAAHMTMSKHLSSSPPALLRGDFDLHIHSIGSVTLKPPHTKNHRPSLRVAPDMAGQAHFVRIEDDP